METMGMTDKQFNAFLRMLIKELKDAKDEIAKDDKVEKLEKTIENLQQSLEN
ncbi:MAG: hypothetical protein Q4A78_12340 [Peptostreptococcaceae bacterium]|nr:hypothetical protein [Peptostreptococcaceae bacterium]